MASMIKDLTGHGWEVVGLDLPGHGGSSGRRLNLKLGVEAAQAASDWLGPFDLIIGHSFGGAVGVNAVTGGIKGIAPLPAAKLVTISAPNSMPALFAGVGRHLRPRNPGPGGDGGAHSQACRTAAGRFCFLEFKSRRSAAMFW